MYLKVRHINAKPGDDDIIINISKMACIQDIKQIIFENSAVLAESQRLFYKGKQLNDDQRVMDYNIQLNDVIQLMVRVEQKVDEVVKNSDDKKVEPLKEVTNTLPERKEEIATSKFFKIDEVVDIIEQVNGSWIEARIINILKCEAPSDCDKKNKEPQVKFRVKYESEKENDDFMDISFEEIRPRSRYTFKKSELAVGQMVLVNYNIEEPSTRGYWYDFIIKKITRKNLVGTIMVGKIKTPLENCTVQFIDEVLRIEKTLLLSCRLGESASTIPLRKNVYYCEKCKDVITKPCKFCGCSLCSGKDDADTIILCDECDLGFHIKCLTPPLTEVPSDPEWYCPSCKRDENEIVKPGEKLKSSKKKSKMASSNRKGTSRDWGVGMGCVGRTKVCTLVPIHHYGAIPGIEVGTCWKYRLQVSEAGIHRPHVAGIHGSEGDGAYSLVLSGGYEDDVDNGDEFFYTGSGGRDLSGNKRVSDQSSNQTLTRMNKALALNCNVPLNEKEGAEASNWKDGRPVRVVRNYKGSKHSRFAPKEGNRYDGIYKVVKYYPETGKSGFLVWRYVLRRDDPVPAPWTKNGQELEMIYPDGYLEAEAAKEASKEKARTSKGKASTSRGKASTSRGKASTSPGKASTSPGKASTSTGKATTSRGKKRSASNDKSFEAKKQKMSSFKIDAEVEKFISNDEGNSKLWVDCKSVKDEGKKAFLTKVEELFMCICCQELVHLPITTECKHNVCKSCLKRSFLSEIFSCPHCRFELGKNFKLNVNTNLSSALLSLFPGYECGR